MDSVTASNADEAAHHLPLWQTHQFFNKPFVSLKQLLTIGKAHSFYLLRNEVNFQKYI